MLTVKELVQLVKEHYLGIIGNISFVKGLNAPEQIKNKKEESFFLFQAFLQKICLFLS